MANGDDTSSPVPQGWMNDVQRALAIIIIGTIAIATLGATMRLIYIGDADSITDMSKTLQAALVNMGLIALGFFFGNTMAKMAQDAGQQKVVEKLTSTNPPTGGPVAPLAAPTIIVAWWSKLTPEEQAAITALAPTDPKAASFMASAQTGTATEDDLAAIVAKGVLTQGRADIIKST